MGAKHIIDDFEGFFEGVKKVEAPSKNPENSPIIVFFSKEKITSQTIRISGALAFLCTGVTVPLEKTLEKPLKIANYVLCPHTKNGLRRSEEIRENMGLWLFLKRPLNVVSKEMNGGSDVVAIESYYYIIQVVGLSLSFYWEVVF